MCKSMWGKGRSYVCLENELQGSEGRDQVVSTLQTHVSSLNKGGYSVLQQRNLCLETAESP